MTYTILWLLAAALLVGADQLIKVWAVNSLSQVDTIPLWEGVLHLTFRKNYGAAFSILQGQTLLLVLFTSAVLVVLAVVLVLGRVKSRVLVSSLSLIVAGGVGNLIDRLTREGGFVVDYIDFRLINFPVFNLADICVVTGTGLMLLYLLFLEGKEHANRGKRHGG